MQEANRQDAPEIAARLDRLPLSALHAAIVLKVLRALGLKLKVAA
jgi:hypothetical protein